MQISLSEPLFHQLQRVAATQGATLHEFLEQVANSYATSPAETSSRLDERWQEQHTKIEREQRVYLAQHAQLLARYAGEYIAMHNGQVIDHDADRMALGQRIRTLYGNQPIFITPVQAEPIQIIETRSPQLISHAVETV